MRIALAEVLILARRQRLDPAQTLAALWASMACFRIMDTEGDRFVLRFTMLFQASEADQKLDLSTVANRVGEGLRQVR